MRDGKRALQLRGSHTLDIAVRVLSSQTPTLPRMVRGIRTAGGVRLDGPSALVAGVLGSQPHLRGRCGDGPVQLDQCRFTQFPQGSLAYRGHKEIGSAENAFQLTQRYALERSAKRQPAAAPCRRRTTARSSPWTCPPARWASTRRKAAPPRPTAATGGLCLHVAEHPASLLGHGDARRLRHAAAGDAVRPRRAGSLPGSLPEHLPSRRRVHHGGESGGTTSASSTGTACRRHLRYHFLATIETPAIMCEYYEHTQDRKFLDEILLPCADEFIQFYELQFPRRATPAARC